MLKKPRAGRAFGAPHPPTRVLRAVVVAMSLALVAVVVKVWPRPANESGADRSMHTRVEAAAPQRVHVDALPVAPSRTVTVSGFVRNEQGGAIALARVCAVCAACDSALGLPTVCTTSEASGAYSLPLDDTRPVTLSASARGFRLGQANAGRPLRFDDSPRAEVDIVLQGAGARLSGSVMDALGGPIADARVQLWSPTAASRSLVETHTDDNGLFELWAAPGSASIHVEAPGYAPVSRAVVAPSQGITLQLTPASTLSGTVVEQATGKPVVGVEVRALFEGLLGRSTAAISGYDGKFSLTGLEPGRYVIAAEHERFRSQRAITVQLALAQVERSLVVPVVPAVSVLGNVLSAQGEACVGGRVSLDPTGVSQTQGASPNATSALVEPDGNVRLRGLTPGHYRVDVRCSEQVLVEGPLQLDIHNEDVHASWRVEPGLGLEVSVVDAANLAVPRAALMLRRPNPDHPDKGIVSPLTADDAGHASTGARLRPGSYTVKPGGGLRGEPLTIELHEGDGRVPVTLHVQGSAWIDVDVQDELAQPVDDLHVSARAAAVAEGVARPQLMPAKPLGGGSYRIGPLEAGRYIVQAADGVNRSWGDTSENAWLSVQNGATVRTKLSIERGARVQGNVRDAHGEPAANVWVEVKDEAAQLDRHQARPLGAACRRLTDSEGHFEIDGLSPRGRFVVSVSDPEAGEGSLRDVQPGALAVLKLTHSTPIASSAGDR